MGGAVIGMLLLPAAAMAQPPWSGPVAIDHNGANQLQSVSCPSEQQCTVIDVNGQAATFDPAAPQPERYVQIYRQRASANAPDEQPFVVGCPSTTECTVLDSLGNEITFDPLTTSRAPVPTHADGRSGARGSMSGDKP
jgi:hypothetical protein